MDKVSFEPLQITTVAGPFVDPYVRYVDSHIAQVADRAPGIGDIQLHCNIERSQLAAAHQQRIEAKLIVSKEKFLTFVQHLIQCPCASALDAGGVLFLIHTSDNY